MHPDLRTFYRHVYPLFWPWLWWNLVRAALWHLRTGQDALLMVDRFGNVRFVHVSDPPKPDGLYTYDPPKVTSWDRLAPGFGLPDPMLEDGIGNAPSRCIRGPFAVLFAVSAPLTAAVRGPPGPAPIPPPILRLSSG